VVHSREEPGCCAYNRLDGKVKRDQCRLLVRQRGILEEWIDARVSAGEGFVLLGDFNRQLDQPRWEGVYLDTGFQAGTQVSAPYLTPAPGCGPGTGQRG